MKNRLLANSIYRNIVTPRKLNKDLRNSFNGYEYRRKKKYNNASNPYGSLQPFFTTKALKSLAIIWYSGLVLNDRLAAKTKKNCNDG